MKKQSGFSSGFGWSQGVFSPQPHVGVPQGTFEEEHGRNGFFGRTSHLYHKHPPTGWLRIEGPHRPRAFRVSELGGEGDFFPEFFLENEDVSLGFARLQGAMGACVRNADHDEVRFIHEGAGFLNTDYGSMPYEKGDYLVLPRGVTYQFEATTPTSSLCIFSASEIGLPDRGMLGRHAQFDPMVMRVPEIENFRPGKSRQNKALEYELKILREGEFTKVFYPFDPLDIAGWKGDLCPWGINVRDIRPIVSPRYHLPPSVHTTFLANHFVICSFLPRPLESEEGAMKVPFYHRNIDFDEVLFYHEGNFFSREGISAGSATWHPQGIHHGPHPNAEKNAADILETKEIAVMIDTKRPLRPVESTITNIEFKEYSMSWRQDQGR